MMQYNVCLCVCVCESLSRVRFLATPWTIARQAPLSMGFSRQEYWSGLPLPSPGDLPNLEIEPGSPALQADSLPSEPQGEPKILCCHCCSVAQLCPTICNPVDCSCRDMQVKPYLFQGLQVVHGATRQQHDHIKLPLRVWKLQDLHLQLIHEANSEQPVLVHHLHVLLFTLRQTR